MKIISVSTLSKLLETHGFENYLRDLMVTLKEDFMKWESFTKTPRPSMHVPGGVMELMPICDNEKYYSFKFVNCHPKNPKSGLATVVATGQLCRIDTGYPVLFSEMTILTALRTAATSALATDLMARKNATVFAIIGTGAQSEFQTRGILLIRDIKVVRYFDIDKEAMDKFGKNMKQKGVKFIRCASAQEAVKGADIITVVTACKAQVDVLKNEWIKKGVHINALGGDTVGKTELELGILSRTRLVVEYFEQSFIEGEIQRFSEEVARKIVKAELHELVKGNKKGRENDNEITLFDSVGIALEDYSALCLTYELSEKYSLGEDMDITPTNADPKDLISQLNLKKESDILQL